VPQSQTNPRQSIWQPLANKLFLAVWLATLFSNIGSWMNDVGAAWLMTSTTASPMMVALVQTATTLPVMLLAIPAGALADIVDRRRYLLATQI
jgi:MFS family permease